MNEDDIEQKIRRFVAEEVGVSESELDSDVDVVDDLKIYGDDVWGLLNHFARAFNVNMDGLRWYHHSGPEGFNLLWLIRKPWWMRKTHIPIRIADLVESARRGQWAVAYPENEREAEPQAAASRNNAP